MVADRPILHFSYHKCLTVYFARVMSRTLAGASAAGIQRNYHHLNSHVERLATAVGEYRAVSVNNHFVDLTRFADYRASRFIRDPRDLIVSGYFYHRRGAEPWSRAVDPTEEDWAVVNGVIPASMPRGASFASYLESLSLEDGLRAELEFRTRHFESMADWPLDDELLLTLRYEDVLGREEETFDRLFAHYGIGGARRRFGLAVARRYSANNKGGKSSHVRNARSGQWRDTLPPRVIDAVNDLYGSTLERYGYPI